MAIVQENLFHISGRDIQADRAVESGVRWSRWRRNLGKMELHNLGKLLSI